MSLGKWLKHWTAHLVAGLLIVTPLGMEQLGGWVPFLSVPLAGLLLSFSSPWWFPVSTAMATFALAAIQTAGPYGGVGHLLIPLPMAPWLAVGGVLRELWQNDWLEGMTGHRWLEAMGWPIGAVVAAGVGGFL